VGVKIVEFLRQDVAVRDEVELLAAEPLLHLHIVVAKSVFPGDFVGLWKVVDALKLIETFVKVTFAGAR
jgi:hypothetical protein